MRTNLDIFHEQLETINEKWQNGIDLQNKDVQKPHLFRLFGNIKNIDNYNFTMSFKITSSISTPYTVESFILKINDQEMENIESDKSYAFKPFQYLRENETKQIDFKCNAREIIWLLQIKLIVIDLGKIVFEQKYRV